MAKIAVLKVGDKTILMPSCPYCGGADFECRKEYEDGHLSVKCKKCQWVYGLDSNGMEPSWLNYLVPVFERQEKQRRELETRLKESKTLEEKDKYRAMLAEMLETQGQEIRQAWKIIRERLGGR